MVPLASSMSTTYSIRLNTVTDLRTEWIPLHHHFIHDSRNCQTLTRLIHIIVNKTKRTLSSIRTQPQLNIPSVHVHLFCSIVPSPSRAFFSPLSACTWYAAHGTRQTLPENRGKQTNSKKQGYFFRKLFLSGRVQKYFLCASKS